MPGTRHVYVCPCSRMLKTTPRARRHVVSSCPECTVLEDLHRIPEVDANKFVADLIISKESHNTDTKVVYESIIDKGCLQDIIENCIEARLQSFALQLSNSISDRINNSINALSKSVAELSKKVDGTIDVSKKSLSVSQGAKAQHPKGALKSPNGTIEPRVDVFEEIIKATPGCPIFTEDASPITALIRFCNTIHKNPNHPNMELPKDLNSLGRLTKAVENFTLYCASLHDNSIAQAFGELIQNTFLDNKEMSRKRIETHLKKHNISSARIPTIMSLWHDHHVPPAATGMKRLFYPLGRCSDEGGFAIHEEDALEYLHNLNKEGLQRAGNALSELRRRDLLLIGCACPIGWAAAFCAWRTRIACRLRKNDGVFFRRRPRPGARRVPRPLRSKFQGVPLDGEEFVAELGALSAASAAATAKPL